ncbi:MAG: hypothetical protein KKG60_04095 [Nanoarchaeota archaeon]|nr:hypothetical protein [Nanoarchaeota archaeon]
MKCSKCKSESIIQLTNNKIHLCKSHFFRYFEAKVIKTIRTRKLIEKGDRVLCEVRNTLASIKILKQYVDWNVITLEVIYSGKGSQKQVADYCKANKIILTNNKVKKKKKQEFTKMALEQNLDDECRDILVSQFSDKINPGNFGPTAGKIIKPFCLMLKDEVNLYSKLRKFNLKHSPQKQNKLQKATSKMLNEIEKKYPGTKFGIINYFKKITLLLRKG